MASQFTPSAHGHQHPNSLDLGAIESAIRNFAAPGLTSASPHATNQHFALANRGRRYRESDLDVRATLTPLSNPFTNDLPHGVGERLAWRYSEWSGRCQSLFGRVTLWGLADGGSRLTDFPIRGGSVGRTTQIRVFRGSKSGSKRGLGQPLRATLMQLALGKELDESAKAPTRNLVLNQVNYQLNHRLGQELELLNPAGVALWRYVYGGKPKPFFHPLCTPRGNCLSLFEPGDHVWHRGLWFAIKFVNGDNFWEENPPFGQQNTRVPPTVTHSEDGSLNWLSELEWQRPDSAGLALWETRQITYRALEGDAYALDWDVHLRGETEVLLDRTPFTTWGGYGGLTIRGNRNWTGTRLLFPDGSSDERPKGVPAPWCDFSGAFDGGKDQNGGIALFDHPANGRHPTPWYGATGSGHYLNAALLFHEAMTLPAGETLRLRYRALIHDDIWETGRLQRAWEDYANDDDAKFQ